MTAARVLTLLLLAQAPLVTSVPGLQLQNGGTSQGQVTKLNCSGAGVTCTRSGSTGTLTVTGGGGGGSGGTPVDAGYVVWGGNSTGSTNERGLANGTNTTIDTATAGSIKVNVSGTLPGTVGGLGATQPTCAGGDFMTCNGSYCYCSTPSGGGGGGAHMVKATVTFDAHGGYAATQVNNQNWVTASSMIQCMPQYSAAVSGINNTPEVYTIASIHSNVNSVIVDPDGGFVMAAYSYAGISGNFNFVCMGL